MASLKFKVQLKIQAWCGWPLDLAVVVKDRLTRLEAHQATLPSRLRVGTVGWRTLHILTLHDSCLGRPYGGCSKGGWEGRDQSCNHTQQTEHSPKPRAWQRHCATSMVQTAMKGHVTTIYRIGFNCVHKSKLEEHAFL